MEITDVRIRLAKPDGGKLKAVASITIDGSFAIHDIKIIEGNAGPFIAMPSRKTPDGEFKDIAHPINADVRSLVSERILAEYQKALDSIR
ncbi:MAG: septation regulator SpoVG [Clostridia bacterium]|nr:septation regulator SpoVG [Clostridia bacterium]